MSDNLIPKIKDDEWFLKLIERRLEENKGCEDDSHRQMNELALMSAIDFRLKYLNSMTSLARKNISQKIMDVCRQRGFIPQYESSGAPVFTGNEIKLSPDGKFIACFDFGSSITLLPTKEFFVWTKLINHEKEKNMSISAVSFSPDSSKIAILYWNSQLKNGNLQIWDIAELSLLISEIVDEYVTEKTLSWSTDSRRITYQKKEKEICVYDFVDKKTIYLDHSAPAVCLNDCGTKILLLNGSYGGRKGTIVELDVESGKELLNKEAEVSLWNPEPLFKNGQFYVLTAGVILKIGEEIVEIIEPDSVISPLNFKNKSNFRDFKLEIENENLIINANAWHEKLDYIISDTLDVKQIRILPEWLKDMNVKANKSKINEITSDLKKRYNDLNYKEAGDNQTVYITNSDSIIGFELAYEDETIIKWNYREYVFEDQPTFNRFQKVPPEFMEEYEKISADNLDSKFQKENRFGIYPKDHENRKMYFRETGETVTIKDASLIKFVTFNNHEYKKIKADDPSKEYYLDGENNLYCVNPFSKSVVKIAENEPIFDCSLNEIKITGSDWPKIYVIGKETSLIIGESQPKKVFIQSAPMQKIVPINSIIPSSINSICIFSNKIYWVDNEQICVSEIDGSDIKRKKLIYLDNWQSLGTTYDGKISLIRIEENERDQKKITIRFARLHPEDGHVDVFEKAALDKYTYQDLKHSLKIDIKDTTVVIRDWLTKIDSMRIKKEGMKSIKVVIPSIDKLDASMTPLDDEKYIISTNEYEKVNKEDEQESIDDSGFDWRPQLRVMDSETGSKTKYKVNQSEGQLYGLPGYAIGKTSKVFSLDDGKFIVVDMKSSNSSAEPPVVLSWDISTGARYPSDKNIIHGKILEKIDENEIRVAEMNTDCQIVSAATYNKKMKKLSEVKPAFNWNMYHNVLNYGMINTENLKQQLRQFPDLPELPEIASDISYYTNVITGIDSSHNIEEGDVLLFPIRICGEKKTKPVFPCISPLKGVKEDNPPIWINIETIVGTLSYGRILNPKKIMLELVTYEGENEKDILRNCLWSVSAYNVNGTYIIQQPIQEKPDDVYEQMKYRTRIIQANDKEEIIINGLTGWQPWVSFGNVPNDEIEDMVSRNRGQFQREKKMISLYAGPESFSYVVSEGEDMCFVTHIGPEKRVKKICNKSEGQPVALYSDEDISISFLPPKKIMFTFEKETKIIDENSHEFWKEALRDLYNYGQFRLTSTGKDGTLRFDIGRKEMHLKGTKIEILEKKYLEIPDHDNSICELSDGIIQNYEGVFVKRYT